MKLKILLVLIAAVGVIVIVFGWRALAESHAKNYSQTPQQVMAKLATSVKAGDANKVRVLFSTEDAFRSFMKVRVNSGASKISKTPLIRKEGQSVLDAWRTWFQKYGTAYLQYKPPTSGKGIVCTPVDNMSFVIRIENLGQGFLITTCSYEL